MKGRMHIVRTTNSKVLTSDRTGRAREFVAATCLSRKRREEKDKRPVTEESVVRRFAKWEEWNRKLELHERQEALLATA